MYIIENKKLRQLQFGFKPLNEVNLNHGIILSDNINMEKNFYNKTDNQIIINNDYFNLNKKISKDFRFNLKSKFIIDFLFIILSFILIIQKYKIKFIKYIYIIFLITIIFKILSISIFNDKNLVNVQEETPVWSLDEFMHYFKNSKIGNFNAQNKFDFVNLEIPKLNGISDYRVLPLNSENNYSVKFTSEIALPYKKLFSIRKDKTILIRAPLSDCNNKKLHFFKIDENDDILVLNLNDYVGDNFYFTIFSEPKIKANICSNESMHKNEIKE